MDSVQTQTDSEQPSTALTKARPNGFAPWTLDTPPDRRLGLAYCEALAFGRTLADIETDPGLPPRDLFLLWVMKDPELAAAFARAREMSSYTLEDEALHLLRLKTKDAKSMVELRAVDLLVQQIRWSAAKRNAQVFSEKAAVNVTVPIQINTSLDMGAGGASNSTKEFPNIYEIEAKHVREEVREQEGPEIPTREAPGGVRDRLRAVPRTRRKKTGPTGKRILQPRAALTIADREAEVAARIQRAKELAEAEVRRSQVARERALRVHANRRAREEAANGSSDPQN